MALEFEPVDVQSLLTSSLTIVREKAATRRISLDLEASDDLGTPELDVRKTKQIVYNLLSNAVRFTAVGGKVTLRARRVSREVVGTFDGEWPVFTFPLPENEYQDYLEICVTDTGIGISAVDMAKLFQAFSQIDSSVARQFDGTGLGLAMVRQLVELHGGTVAVASAVGEGSRFAAWLPVRVPTEAAGPAPQAIVSLEVVTPVAPEARTALVIEDEDGAAELMRLLLEAEGFGVVRAASAEDGLRLASEQRFRLITLDLQLPGMGGWEFLARLREDNALAHIPVMVVANVVDGSMALLGGASESLQKPVSRAQLNGSLARLGLLGSQEHARSVLIVDDDPKAVEVIAALLPAPGYSVARAYGGTEAISLARRSNPDLIVLDLLMRGVTGFDVVEALRADPATTGIPILVVTAKQITEQDRAMLNGRPGTTISIMTKARFDRDVFIADVRRALAPSGRRAADGSGADR